MTKRNNLQWWEKLGFGDEPKLYPANGNEIICRAFSPREVYVSAFDSKPSSAPPGPLIRANGDTIRDARLSGSRELSNCFFVGKTGYEKDKSGTYLPIQNYTIPRSKWTGEYLERNLNAFVWENAFHKVAVFRLEPGTLYLIGSVGQDTQYEVDIYNPQSGKAEPTVQRYIPMSGSGDFLQVTIKEGQGLDKSVTKLYDFDVIQPLDRFGSA